MANSSTHYGSVTQQAGLTWLPNPRWDLSLNPNVSFNFRNGATDYRSGTLFGLTGGISYRPLVSDLRWQIGVNG
ncbi:MAG: transporter [Gammaproteobacteria bacterium]|nr:transporter [Gammaproteobacteria bacterium]